MSTGPGRVQEWPVSLGGEESGGAQAPSLPSAASPLAGWLEGGLALLDASGRIHEINEPFMEWLEKPAAELKGCSLWTLLAERCYRVRGTRRLA